MGQLRRSRQPLVAAATTALPLALIYVGLQLSPSTLFGLVVGASSKLPKTAVQRCPPSAPPTAATSAAIKFQRVRGNVAREEAPREITANTAEDTGEDPAAFGSLDLLLPKPALLLNHVADRYVSISHILMEFIDNSLDSAEAFFDGISNGYTRAISIEIFVDSASGTLRVVDNCQGMLPETLARVTTNVGESQKQGQPFLSGQFGFGMQAFRACCRKLRVRSRISVDEPLLEITVDRETSRGFSLLEAPPESSTSIPAAGTEVTLLDLEEQWASEVVLSPSTLVAEIEAHFERLLFRGNLTVAVHSPGGMCRCRPLDYEKEGAEIVVDKVVNLGGGQRAEVLLGVAPVQLVAAWHRPARFFSKGRRIRSISDIQSFAKGSAHRWDVWAHPQLVGYIDILGDDDGPLRPVITRDEFKGTRQRASAYRRLAKMTEGPLHEALLSVNEVRNLRSLQSLEDVLTVELQRVDRAEKRAERAKRKVDWLESDEEAEQLEEFGEGELPVGEPPVDETVPEREAGSAKEGDKEEKEQEETPGQDGLVVQLCGNPDDPDGDESWRSSLVANTIMVNTRHSDFRERFKRSRSGAPKVDERLCSYLATIISAHYRNVVDEKQDGTRLSRSEAFETIIGTYCRYENRLRKCLSKLVAATQADLNTA